MERRVIHRETKVATLGQMRAAAEALKGVDRACDITQAKPEFVEFIRKCSPASVLAVLNRHFILTEQRDRLATALTIIRDSYWSENEPYAMRVDQLQDIARDALATVEQGGGESSG